MCHHLVKPIMAHDFAHRSSLHKDFKFCNMAHLSTILHQSPLCLNYDQTWELLVMVIFDYVNLYL